MIDTSETTHLIQRSMCVVTKRWGPYYSFWIPIIAYEAFLFCLALYKGYEETKLGLLEGKSNLLIKLVRDSTMYFFVYVSDHL